ncbi:MAG: RagB/SusD family nutrient uptake outer membrane protein [Pedobacter sp.]|uniref:RagB/SusD family nutrient uptake outer membrane protein n=1 Tax=Pedobacter sp. TaxID=1411316 RepID=UPI003562AC31
MKRVFKLYLIVLGFLFSACHKDFLDERSSKSLVVPETLQDYQALLDNTGVMNVQGHSSVVMDGDFEFLESAIVGQSATTRNSYLWKVDIYETLLSTPSWTYPYKQILPSNIVIEGLKKISPGGTSQMEYNALLGSAYFFRAFAFHELAVLFSAPYQENIAELTPGLPLKLSADVTQIVQRSTLKATYDQIIADLNIAIDLLPNEQPVISRPIKAAAYAQLSRVNLNMGRFEDALSNAKEALKLRNELLDYNKIVISTSRTFAHPFTTPNPEILFWARDNFGVNNSSTFLVKQSLYDSYASNDLRKSRFFTAARRFIGTYTGLSQSLCGLTTREVYLIAAECEARSNKTNEALDYLNTLCQKRYDGTFVGYQSSDAEQVLHWVLEERRKELVTVRRWEDLRRLNLDSRFAQTLTRTYLGELYNLPPKSSRYVLAIPQGEISESGITQNERKLD